MTADKKKAHIDLAIHSQTDIAIKDNRFHYEPLLAGHPSETLPPFPFLGKTMRVPIWVSSMTGGTELAMIINRNLAKACKEFGMGMGLGSCRVLLENNRDADHFFVKEYIGDEVPFYANLGIIQIEQALTNKSVDRIEQMVDQLQVDGLFIHVNPLQEYLQPEGEFLKRKPIEVIQEFIEKCKLRIVVKEVGQGMGPESLRHLLQLPLEGIEFAAFGGTNFAKLELHRDKPMRRQMLEPLSLIGNDAADMLDFINQQVDTHLGVKVNQLIISGGIKSFLDGYYYIKKSKIPAVYGQASAFLKYAREDYESLREFIEYQIAGLKVAFSYLTLKEKSP